MAATNFRALIHDKFDKNAMGRLEQDAITGIIILAEEYELEEEIIDFLSRNPGATLREALNYADDIAPEGSVEIVDDDELDDEDD